MISNVEEIEAVCVMAFAGTGWFLSPAIMTSNLLAPAQWAQTEFALAELGDQRRTQHLVKMATCLAQTPTGTLPQAFPAWSELKAAYRFLDHLEFGPAEIQQPHRQHTLEACRQPGEYLLIEDTTELDYSSHRCREQLGFIGNGQGRGMLVHSTLALRVEAWDLAQAPEGIALGLLGQTSWVRPVKGLRQQPWRQRMRRSRESDRWARGLAELGSPPPGCQWIYLADREADFYEPIQRCQRQGVDFIIRGYHDHKLAGADKHLSAALAQAPVQGVMKVALRGRQGAAAREAKVSLRQCRVKWQGPWRPQGLQEDVEINVVEAREVAPPEGVEGLHWVLLTSLPCERLAELKRIVARYALRWWMEQYHKALKSGAGIEESQLEKGFRIENLLAVLAVRLVNTQWLARHRPDEPVAAESFGARALELLSAKYEAPTAGWTNRTVLIAVARLGGFLARKQDGLPGWQTIWRGWRKLMCMCEGLEILKEKAKRCG
jgi:transposase-like protein/DDE family transposase